MKLGSEKSKFLSCRKKTEYLTIKNYKHMIDQYLKTQILFFF